MEVPTSIEVLAIRWFRRLREAECALDFAVVGPEGFMMASDSWHRRAAGSFE